MTPISTGRLNLIPLGIDQLRAYLGGALELEGMAVSQAIMTDRLRRAISMKIEKMVSVDEREHPWFTYWLVVVRGDGFGAGMMGFKGLPDQAGEVEIGYGIDPGYRGMGYTTEAARALIEWAFRDERCRAVVAPDTERSNIASNRVLEKVGMRVYSQTETSISWRVDRDAGRL